MKNRPVALGEFAVETGVVGDDDHRFVRERRYGRFVYSVPTISFVIPVSAMTSGGIGSSGSSKAISVELIYLLTRGLS